MSYRLSLSALGRLGHGLLGIPALVDGIHDLGLIQIGEPLLDSDQGWFHADFSCRRRWLVREPHVAIVKSGYYF